MSERTEHRHFAMVPIHNLGSDRLSSYQFKRGIALDLGCPRPIREILPSVAQQLHMPASESMCFQLARGWLWTESHEAPDRLEDDRNIFAITQELANDLWQAVWCIDLAGCGENDYWRSPGFDSCAVYRWSSDGSPLLAPIRKPFLHCQARHELRDIRWSAERLSEADRLLSKTYSGLPHKRLQQAQRLRLRACSIPPERNAERLALVISAIEVLFVEPDEHLYAWSEDVRRRIRNVCADAGNLSDRFFEQLRDRRCNAVHRGGLTQDGASLIPFSMIDVTAEDALRRGIVWTILNAT